MVTTIYNVASPSSSLMHLGGEIIAKDTFMQISDSISIDTETTLGASGAQTITELYGATGQPALVIKSSNVQDTSTGAGARTVVIPGWDVNDNLISETVSMLGTTAVPLTSGFCVLGPMYALTAGSGHATSGNVTISSGSVYYSAINPTGTMSSHASMYIPDRCQGAMEFEGWFTKATTATDGLKISVTQYINNDLTIPYVMKTIGFGETSGLTTCNQHFTMPLTPGYYKVSASKIGSTAQTLNFTLGWGYVKQ